MSETLNQNDVPVTGRTLWLAGLGAAAVAAEQGRKLFDDLVERGRPVARKQIEVLDKVGDRTAAVLQDAVKRVRGTIEHEAKAAVQRLDLLTHSDVKILSARLEALAKRLDEIAHQGAKTRETRETVDTAESHPVDVDAAEVAAETPARARARTKAH